MKIQLIAAAALAVFLSACGEKHETVRAVDKLAEAEAEAVAKAPQAEEIKFDDHGQPTFAQTQAGSATAAPQAEASEPTEGATETEAKAEETKAEGK